MKKLAAGVAALIWILPASPRGEEAPRGWAPFSISDEALRCGNYSKHNWEVSFKGKNLKISSAVTDKKLSVPFEIDLRGRRRAEKIKGGWLIGSDAGEWGGALWWFSNDGLRRRKLAEGNVVGLAKVPAGVLVFTGLAHLGTESGQVLRVEAGADGWKTRKLADLGAAPGAFAAEPGGSALVVTTKGLVRVKAEGTIEELFPVRYRALYPNSMALADSGTVYVGMRHFITRLTPEAGAYKEEWFVPGDCRNFKVKGLNCVCSGAAGK